MGSRMAAQPPNFLLSIEFIKEKLQSFATRHEPSNRQL
jgi:hypothetical protein